MADSIGITHSGIVQRTAALSTLKKLAVVFDRIYLVDLSSGYFRFENIRDEIDWLCENNVIFKPKSDMELLNDLDSNEMQEFVQSVFKESDLAMSPLEHLAQGKTIHLARFSKMWVDYFDVFFDTFSRFASVSLRKTNRISAYPILKKLTHRIGDLPADKVDVMRIVINSLPTPSNVTSWEQILEYRNDEDTKGKLLALKNWMSDVARAKLSPVEVEEKLEWLIYDYERHMKLHSLKTNRGTLETIITTTAELAEDLVKFRWSKLAKTLFSLKQRQIQLLEGEMNLPGNEIAYIIKTRQKFSR